MWLLVIHESWTLESADISCWTAHPTKFVKDKSYARNHMFHGNIWSKRIEIGRNHLILLSTLRFFNGRAKWEIVAQITLLYISPLLIEQVKLSARRIVNNHLVKNKHRKCKNSCFSYPTQNSQNYNYSFVENTKLQYPLLCCNISQTKSDKAFA